MRQYLPAFLLAALMAVVLSNTTAQRAFIIKANGMEYPAISALFGGADNCDPSGYMGEWVIALDNIAPVTNACEPLLNDLTGKIALIDRDMCGFDVKCLNAQNAGAVAVVVCNNTYFTPPFAMGLSSPATGAAVTIPSFMASKQDCDVLRLLTPLEISLTPVYPKFPKAKVLWGKYSGQGDFSDGLNDWTVQNSICSNGAEDFEVWRWDANGVLEDHPLEEAVIHSPTACNGAAFFDSGQYDISNSPNGPMQGPCPAPQSGELVSPVINLSNAGVPGVSLQFFQAIRNYNSRFFIGYSSDGGATWTEVEINTDLEINGPPLNNIQKIPLPGLTGSAQARFKFRMEADYYYWMIDDVRIVEQEHNNLSLNKNFYAIPPSYSTPLSMVEPIHFLADVSNIGSVAQTNAKLKVSILNQQNQNVFQTTRTFNQLPPNSTLKNVLLDESFEPNRIGTYRGTYRISADAADADKSNNQAFFEFKVTDNVWAKESGATRTICPDASAWEAGEPHTWAIGNHFATPDFESLFYVANVAFSLDGSEAMFQVPLFTLYQWSDVNNDGLAQAAERDFLSFIAYLIDGTETEDDIITLEFDEPVYLESNTHYLLMMEYIAPNDQMDICIGASDAYDYGAMTYTYGPAVLGIPRYASMMAIGDLSDATFVPNGFGSDIVPVLRLLRYPSAGLGRAPSTDAVQVYPNPAKNFLNVACKFEQPTQNVVIRIVDATGRIIYQEQKGESDWNSFRLDISHLSTGVYHLLATSETGESSCRFAVVNSH